MKRIGVAQVWQESNHFNPVLTTIADFRRYGLASGKRVLDEFGDVDELGGFVSGLGEWPEAVEAAGVLRALAWPSGPMSRCTLEWFTHAICDQLEAAGPLDGLLFSLHGALVSEVDADVDGLLLARARAALGDGIPLVATVDCHAHVTPRMLRHADVVLAYHTNPHVDRAATGRRAARALARLLEGVEPVCAGAKLPMITGGEPQSTAGDVLGPIFARLRQLESRNDILSAAVLMTQPWLDVPRLGWTAMVFTDGDASLAADLTDELAEMCWSRRERLRVEYCGADEAVSRALSVSGKPVIIADGADATNSGACGDSTHLLRALTAREVPGAALTIVVDREAVAHARAVGAGAVFAFPVGGKLDHIFSRPLPLTGEVVSLQSARYILSGHLGDNLPVDMGLSAAVRIGDVTVLLVEFGGPGSSPMMYRCVGLEPEDFKIVVVKSPAGFRAEYEPFAAEIILTDCPGCASPHFAELPYRNMNRPLWPLDDIADRHDVEWASSQDLPMHSEGVTS